ncbi:MAG: PqqD family peptide modification chaperone [Elusimicrobiota bacterium]
MSGYQRLIRDAWKSGEYRAGQDKSDASPREEGEALREYLRSRMEWIVEREACAPEDFGVPAAPRGGPGLRLAPHVRVKEEGSGGVLYETRLEKVYRLSPTGVAVLREISAGCGSAEAAVERAAAGFHDPRGSARSEALEFVARLLARGLLVR